MQIFLIIRMHLSGLLNCKTKKNAATLQRMQRQPKTLNLQKFVYKYLIVDKVYLYKYIIFWKGNESGSDE